MTANLPSNLWTRVELRMTRSPETAQVVIAGVNSAPCDIGILDDTVTDVTIGMRGYPANPGWSVYYDNVVAVVRR